MKPSSLLLTIRTFNLCTTVYVDIIKMIMIFTFDFYTTQRKIEKNIPMNLSCQLTSLQHAKQI